jgi:hypothetical protein
VLADEKCLGQFVMLKMLAQANVLNQDEVSVSNRFSQL